MTISSTWQLPEINTWRLCNKAVSQTAVMAMTDAWEAAGYRFGSVCIDDGWQDGGLMGDWQPCPRRFPDLRGMVNRLHARGYGVRLWLAPAQFHLGTAIAEAAFPQAVMTRSNGQPSFYTGLGTYTLDIRHEVARDHVRRAVREVIERYDVDALKLDFPPFYTPGDSFYQDRDFLLAEREADTMVSDFFGLVREACDSVKAGVRIEGYPNCHGAAPFLDDIISGDLVGESRSHERLRELVAEMQAFVGEREIVPWFEMAWGEGSDSANSSVEWHAGYLEFLAASINFHLKLEHSFQPFAYPNADQIRSLTNLYGPRDRHLKVLVAGRRTYPVAELLAIDPSIGPGTRFLAAPETAQTVTLHTAPLRTDAINWQARDACTGRVIQLRARNEFWGDSLDACRVQFEAEAGRTYLLWYEGEETTYFADLYANSLSGDRSYGRFE